MVWERSKLLGDHLPEFDALDYDTDQAYYMLCPECCSKDADTDMDKEGECNNTG